MRVLEWMRQDSSTPVQVEARVSGHWSTFVNMDDTDDSSAVDQLHEHEWPEPPVDPILRDLVTVANDDDGEFEIGVTLHTAGGIVTGSLIGMNLWCARAAEAYPLAAPLYKAWRTDGDDEDEADATIPPAHIHLADARFVGTSPELVAEQGIFWRGRLAEVAGWTLLQFNSGDDES